MSASATLYPDKILIQTIDSTKEGIGLGSVKITILPVDSRPEMVGAAVRKHIQLAQVGIPRPLDYKKTYADFLRAAGFRTRKAHYKDARYLSVSEKQDLIVILPTINGGSAGKNRGFGFMQKKIEVSAKITDEELGLAVRSAWDQCE